MLTFIRQKQPNKKNVNSFIGKQIVQPKLSIGSTNNAFEQEADAIADKVISISDAMASTTPHTRPLVQRKCAQCEQEEKLQKKPLASAVTPLIQQQSHGTEAGAASQALSQQISSSKGGGTGMDNNTRAFMESRFGADFSTVKIHTDNQAVQMSRALNAHAFTVGSDIYFNEGQYKPAHTSGKHLLAHELTHVLQQSGYRHVQRQTEDECPSGNISDSNVQAYIDEALNNSLDGQGNYNLQEAFDYLLARRQLQENCCNLDMAAAEHYMYARLKVMTTYNIAVMTAMILAYSGTKVMGLVPRAGECPLTPVSSSMISWALNGAADGEYDAFMSPNF